LEPSREKSAAAKKERGQKNVLKARAAQAAKIAQRKIVEEKVKNDLPITEQERDLLNWRGGRVTSETQKRLSIAAAAKLVIKPQSVTELRLLVESTAAKMRYNPIQSLIELTQSDEIKESEKIAIHKALLPFLVPQLATPKPSNEAADTGVKVTVTQFVFPKKDQGAPKIHTEKPAMVETTTAS